MPTIYASFATTGDCEKAAGALLDHGALPADVSVLTNEGYGTGLTQDGVALSTDSQAKSGISTTTGEDAAYGAVKGSVVGFGLGMLGAIAAVTLPGIGIVLGGGALAAAAAAALGSTVAGATAGGVVGFLKDQGVGEDYVTRYSDAIQTGGSILAVQVPTGDLSDVEVEQVLAKYGATNVSLVGGESPIMDRSELMEPAVAEPMIGQRIPIVDPAVNVISQPVTPTTLNSIPTTPGAAVSAINAADIEPTRVDPVTGTMQEGVAIDPLTGVERPVARVDGGIVEAQPVVVPGFTMADVVATSHDPVTGAPTGGTITDPVTGQVRTVRIVNGSIIYADQPPQAI